MFLFRRSHASSTRLRALRALYRSFIEKNGSEARARRLLREWLSPDQLAQFDAKGYFEVTGSHTGRRYRIHQGTMSNVWELNEELEPKTGWWLLTVHRKPPASALVRAFLAMLALELEAMVVRLV